MVMAVSRPRLRFNSKDERVSMTKPAISTAEVVQRAVPTVEKA